MSGETDYDAHLEARPDGTVLAQILELPGCFGAARTEEEALRALVAALPGYYAWLSRHDDYTPVVHGPFQVTVKERQGVGAFFGEDAAPVSGGDLDWGLALLDWALADLRGLAGTQPPGSLIQSQLGGRPTVEALASAATRTLTILSCLDGQPVPPLPQGDPATVLAGIRAAWDTSVQRLRALNDEQRGRVFDSEGERWSVRKLLRRGILLLRELTAALERPAS